ncbi:MAG: ribonuclease P protein component [Lachnospiraceae bacterium]|nr:ribonuclease P protein component [Lachnospiraceae bacterium]
MAESIKKNEDFKLFYQNGKSFANKYLIMYALKNGKEFDRLGISVSKKVGNSVVRHRIARLLRESFRLNDETFHSGWDIVVVARKSAKGKDYKDIEGAFLHLTKMHKIIK